MSETDTYSSPDPWDRHLEGLWGPERLFIHWYCSLKEPVPFFEDWLMSLVKLCPHQILQTWQDVATFATLAGVDTRRKQYQEHLSALHGTPKGTGVCVAPGSPDVSGSVSLTAGSPESFDFRHPDRILGRAETLSQGAELTLLVTRTILTGGGTVRDPVSGREIEVPAINLRGSAQEIRVLLDMAGAMQTAIKADLAELKERETELEREKERKIESMDSRTLLATILIEQHGIAVDIVESLLDVTLDPDKLAGAED